MKKRELSCVELPIASRLLLPYINSVGAYLIKFGRAKLQIRWSVADVVSFTVHFATENPGPTNLRDSLTMGRRSVWNPVRILIVEGISPQGESKAEKLRLYTS